MNKKSNRLSFIVGEVAPINPPDGLSCFLAQANDINFCFKLEDIQKDEIGHFSIDKIKLSLQKYDRLNFDTHYDCYSFGINIGEAFENGLSFCNFNIALSTFNLTKVENEDEGYGFNFFLIDENNIVRAIRRIGSNKVFSELIYNVYQNTTSQEYVQNLYEESLHQVGLKISNYYNPEIIEKFSVGWYSQD